MATATKAATKEPRTRGQPASPHKERFMLRHHEEQMVVWRNAATTSGLTLPEWMRQTLDAEARKATHVPIVKRAK